MRPDPRPPQGHPSARRLGDLRKDINRADDALLELLARRRALSREVAAAKRRSRTPRELHDPRREERMLGRLVRAGRRRGLESWFVTQVFHEILDDSRRLQQGELQRMANAERPEPARIRVVFQGIEGAYSHLAALQYFTGQQERLIFSGRRSFAEVVRAVEQGDADYAMLPIENTVSGGIHEVYDLLVDTRLAIVGEEKFPVRHCLVAAGDVALDGVRRILSHPQAVAQCSDFLAGLRGCQVEYFHDTAMSVARIKDEGDPTQAAIASEEAARLFGLRVLARDVANQKENYTRFLVAALEPRRVDPRVPCKTSLVMATGQKPGALVEALLVFRQHGLNLSKLESRPIPGRPWEEMFYVDFAGNVAGGPVAAALDELTRVTTFLKVLGSYPSRDLPRTSPPPSALGARAPVNGKRRSRGAAGRGGAAPITVPAVGAGEPAACKSWRLASRHHKREDTVIEAGGVRIGGDGFVVLAGPCSVESRQQILDCAREVKEHGGQVLRGGCFKPRTSPYSFQGLGFEGLDHLVEAGRRYGMPVITEVLSPGDVQPVAARADILQIGARNMQNFTLLREVGRVHRPVMLKRGLMSSLDELLQAAEYILAQGNQQVFLCERGIRTFETATRNTLDLSAIPILRARTHLPVVVDPSHAAGERDVVPPLARAAKAIGAHGIMVEIHPCPEEALSDGPQALLFDQFESLMADLL